jgi:hypothetical protein
MRDVTKPASSRGPETADEPARAIHEASFPTDARSLEDESDEDLDRELREAGLDPERIAREGSALAKRLLKEAEIADVVQAPPAMVTPEAPRRSPRWPYLFVAVAIGLVGLEIESVIVHRDPPPPSPERSERKPPGGAR